ncbi:NADH-quinone oxidoreductase subunit J [Permianibacter sp. IMCC34836]|nr:NADH-quinone oxidoreductase subunit J [Permianibacter fluminis]
MKVLVFYVFAALTLVSATMVITVRNAVRAVLSLVLTFFCAAVLWLLTEAEFLSIALVLVYVGAVMVLFLFVVMMLDVDYAAVKQGFTRYLPLGVIAALLVFFGIWGMVRSGGFSLGAAVPAGGGVTPNIEVLGKLLYTDYFYAFELAAVILLVALIAAVALTFRGTRMRKIQDVGRQVNVSKEERLRIVKVEPVKPSSQKTAPAATGEQA